MTDSLLNTSIATLRTELLAAIPTATASELMNIARSAKGLGLSEDTSIETAINSRANTLTNTATSEDIIKISGAVKQMLTPAGASGGGGGSVDLTAVSTNIIPDTDITYDLGSTTHKFKDLYLDGSTLNLGNQTIKATATGIEVPELKIGTGTNTVKLTVASDGKLTTTETDSSGNTSSPAAAGGGSSVTVSDTAPTSPSAGDQWYDSSSLTMFVYYVDGSSSQWIPATPAGQTGATGAAGADGTDGTAGYATVVTDMAGLIAITGMVAGQTALVTALNKVFMYTGSAWYLIATMTNASPTAITGVNATYDLATDGTATTITAVSTDPEGFPLTWSYAVTTGSLGSTATVSQADNVFTITPSTTEADAGSFSITFSVTDGATGAVNAVSAFTLAFAPQQIGSDTIYTTGSGTYSIPSGANYVKVFVTGGGAGGGGATGFNSSWYHSGGGGAGGTVIGYLAVSGGSITYTVGASGTGGTGTSAGLAGGTSTLNYNGTDFAIGAGGNYSGPVSGNNQSNVGGAGGSATHTGMVSVSTQNGSAGGNSIPGGNGTGGDGGTSYYGTGGAGGNGGSGTAASTTHYGAGGGGAASLMNPTSGGAGADGYIVIQAWTAAP